LDDQSADKLRQILLRRIAKVEETLAHESVGPAATVALVAEPE
jgi:hypothetical protein